MTSMLLRRKETAAVEITALAAGAGPPAKRMATRRMLLCDAGGRESGVIAPFLRDTFAGGACARNHEADFRGIPQGYPEIGTLATVAARSPLAPRPERG